jgi:tripartite-type tricarboxylate transporter receptor subunit TctC
MATGAAYAAKTFPAKPVRRIVPFSIGSSTDISGRMPSLRLSESFR